MAAPYSVLALDLHNTIYDEALEYGLAIEEGIGHWLELAKTVGKTLDKQALYGELSLAHRKLGSDFDSDVWWHTPMLLELGFEHEAMNKEVLAAEAKRKQLSRTLATGSFYAGLRDTLVTLKARGTRIYVVTEAAADAGMEMLSWLGLAGIVDGFYSYPSRNAPMVLPGTYQRAFPDRSSGGHLKKPHPFLLAQVALDDAIRRGRIPQGVKLFDVVEARRDVTLKLNELPNDAVMQEDVSTRLVIKNTPHTAALEKTLSKLLYVGDSKFKDGFLARNAGVAFGHAAYGKKVNDQEQLDKSLAIMYAVTGWEKGVLQLTQEAGKSAAVNAFKPDYIFNDSLSEALNLFT